MDDYNFIFNQNSQLRNLPQDIQRRILRFARPTKPLFIDDNNRLLLQLKRVFDPLISATLNELDADYTTYIVSLRALRQKYISNRMTLFSVEKRDDEVVMYLNGTSIILDRSRRFAQVFEEFIPEYGEMTFANFRPSENTLNGLDTQDVELVGMNFDLTSSEAEMLLRFVQSNINQIITNAVNEIDELVDTMTQNQARINGTSAIRLMITRDYDGADLEFRYFTMTGELMWIYDPLFVPDLALLNDENRDAINSIPAPLKIVFVVRSRHAVELVEFSSDVDDNNCVIT